MHKILLFRILPVYFNLLLFCANITAQTVSVTATFPDSISPGESFEVPFTIEKGSVSSFAKFQVDVPSGFYANPVDIHGGNWTFEQSRAKIVWVSIPSETGFKLKLGFKALSSLSSITSVSFTVKFFYLDNNVKKELDLNPYSVKISETSGNAVAANSVTTSTSTAQVTTTTNPTDAATDGDKSATKTNTSVTNETQKTNESNVTNSSKPTASGNILFRVQIGAFSNKPPQSKFAGLKDIWMYEENGLTKVTTGKFSTLKEAEDYKNQLKTKGTDGFVIEFDNGIHVKIH